MRESWCPSIWTDIRFLDVFLSFSSSCQSLSGLFSSILSSFSTFLHCTPSLHTIFFSSFIFFSISISEPFCFSSVLHTYERRKSYRPSQHCFSSVRLATSKVSGMAHLATLSQVFSCTFTTLYNVPAPTLRSEISCQFHCLAQYCEECVLVKATTTTLTYRSNCFMPCLYQTCLFIPC